MKLIVIGNPSSIEEFKTKFAAIINKDPIELTQKKKYSSSNSLKIPFKKFIFLESHDSLNESLLQGQTLIFDFLLDESMDNFEYFKNYGNLIIFGNIPKTTLAEFSYVFGNFDAVLFGFNGLPGMFDRRFLEVSIAFEAQKELLHSICTHLKTEYLTVQDRVGMVTPRIISMIINEAYYTLQEGTANRDDIDTGMKLGTNYPYGPFEFCKILGVKNVYEVLEAIYEDTKDERYKICPLLKREYLMAN